MIWTMNISRIKNPINQDLFYLQLFKVQQIQLCH